MSDPVAALNGHRTKHVRIWVPNVGPWFFDADLVDKVDLAKLAGKVTLTVGDLELVGTVHPVSSGTFGEATTVRVVAGAGQWGKLLRAKGYHNDGATSPSPNEKRGSGVKAITIVTDAARETGETLGTFKPANDRVGDDYVRRAGPASQVLEDALGGRPWWVDYAGVTHGGERPKGKPAAADAYELLEYDPRSRMATLAMDDLTAVSIGTVLEQRLDAPQTVRELEVTIAEGAMRVRAWCGDDARALARLPALLEAFIKRATGGKLYGKYRYRLVSMGAGVVADARRTNLQAVSKAVGLPDMLLIHMTPRRCGRKLRARSGRRGLCRVRRRRPDRPDRDRVRRYR